jgi:oxepin-CoA hydrolase/3-oxo-5,6-dehydrosuberyl-CoA semialdehyde dehydrogenase
MQKLQNYVLGAWVSGSGDGVPQYNAYTGEILSTASDAGLDYAAILDYGRQTGGSPLRRMTFPERGRMLKALAFYLLERKEKYYTVSHLTGATKADSWVDIEGGIRTLWRAKPSGCLKKIPSSATIF